MTEYLRVKDPVSGAEYTYTREQMAVTGLTDADVIDKDPLGVDGQPAPPKPRLAPGETLPGSAADRRRSSKKASKNAAPEAVPGLTDRTVADLKAEIAQRNTTRDENTQIVVSPPGNKAELVAALTADDEAQAESPQTTEATDPGESDGQSSAASEKES